MSPDFIDIHTHSPRSAGIYVMNVFAQDLIPDFRPANPCTVGLHPWHLTETDCINALAALEKAAAHQLVVGIGECGLDKNISTPLNIQEENFLKQLEIAEKFQKPAIIHCVKAYSEMLHIRKRNKWKKPWLFHWFNASREVAADLLDTGCYLSFGRSLLHPNGKNAVVLRNVPTDRIFFETDDAEISIVSVYEKASQVMEIPVDELKKIIRSNYQKLFMHG
ncbi:MAG: TatD family hydrolase [Bacteroidales bacterium]